MYLFNFNNASEYSFMTLEAVNINQGGVLKGRQGGGVLTETQATETEATEALQHEEQQQQRAEATATAAPQEQQQRQQ